MKKLIKEVDYNEIFNPEMQKLFIDYLISDKEAFALCRNILNEDFFDAKLSSTMKFVLEYAEDHKAIPTPEIIKARTGIPAKVIETDPSQRSFFLEEIEKFCRYKALQNAIMDGAKLLETGRGGEVENLVKKAVEISLQTNLGMDYFENPKARLARMMDNTSFVSTGWKVLDDKLEGGFTPGTLNIFCGGSGSGKSLFLQNITLNWANMGKNVVYFSLELSEELIAKRFDAMISNRGTKALFIDIDETAFEIIKAGKSAGKIFIKRLKEGSTTHDMRAYLKEFQIKMGFKPDAVVLDYLDLVHPNNKGIDVSNLFIKDKYTSEEFRGLMEEENYLSATASQMGRQSLEAQGEFNQSHIAGGISKINTSDNTLAIYTNNTMKENGEYELTMLKARNSDSVGQSVKFGYNNKTMRITDPIEVDANKPTSKASLKAEMKPKKLMQENSTEEVKPSSSVMEMMAKLAQKRDAKAKSPNP